VVFSMPLQRRRGRGAHRKDRQRAHGLALRRQWRAWERARAGGVGQRPAAAAAVAVARGAERTRGAAREEGNARSTEK
jgi:hypothetical protein